MNLLCVDTSTDTLDIAIIKDNQILDSYSQEMVKGHSSILLQEVDNLLKQNGLKATDMDAFVSTTGPGSFTGTRVGAAFVMGMARGLGKKAYGISSLKLLALNAKEKAKQQDITTVVPAGRGAYYISSYSWNGEELIEKEKPKRETAEKLNLYDDKIVYKIPNKWQNFTEEDMERIHIQYIGGQV